MILTTVLCCVGTVFPFSGTEIFTKHLPMCVCVCVGIWVSDVYVRCLPCRERSERIKSRRFRTHSARGAGPSNACVTTAATPALWPVLLALFFGLFGCQWKKKGSFFFRFARFRFHSKYCALVRLFLYFSPVLSLFLSLSLALFACSHRLIHTELPSTAPSPCPHRIGPYRTASVGCVSLVRRMPHRFQHRRRPGLASYTRERSTLLIIKQKNSSRRSQIRG